MNIGSLKILIKFNTEYLFEEVSSTYLTVNTDEISPSNNTGGGIATLLPDGAGYVMTDDQYLLGTGVANGGYIVGASNQITIGFWLYPVNYGLVINPSGNTESMSMPLLTLADSSTHSQVIKLREHTSEDNENYLTVDFNGSDYILTSDVYAANMWHYVWLACDRLSGNFNIYIDGKAANSSKVGNSSTVVSSEHMDLYINFSQEGYAYNMAKNYGYIDDIFVLNEAVTNGTDMQNVINNGIDYLIDTSFRTKITDGYNIYFNDPTTITINSIVDDMSYVYLGRNDGKILRGSPLFWETRKVYMNKNEGEVLGLTPLELEDNGIQSGTLELKNTTIRL